ncbi:flagellar brake protein [Salidesulfovibrio brasiliensis]|uniref:flagellar brake protein n=1 Tax=Salidesulfovibrio brasiliensis TaxID=221711 RepID=UPI0006CF65EB|nr:flagellar brake protein [Salidesulfovibrio brasiliensis]
MQTQVETSVAEEASSGNGQITKMPGVNLEVALGADIVVKFPGVPQGYRGRIVGFDPYEYIASNVRLPSSVRQSLSYKGSVVIKYVHEGTVYGFESVVLNHITRPAPLLFFDYPDTIEKLDLRKSSRTNCNIDGTLHTSEADYDCLVVNASETGCRLSVAVKSRDALTRAQVDDDMVVSLALGNLGNLKLPIVIRNIETSHGVILLGCMFTDINEEEQQLITAYVERIAKLAR